MTIKLVSQDLLYFVLISFIFKSWDTDIFEVHRILDLYVYPLSLFIPFIPFQTMRKIEQQMNEAILNRKDFFKGNTSVENYITETGAREAIVKLHGNHIATVGDTLQICDAGWQTVTTKSRLNALCNEFAEGCYVFQRNFDWFLGDADGNVLPFPTEEFVTV
mgnify:FL=1